MESRLSDQVRLWCLPQVGIEIASGITNLLWTSWNGTFKLVCRRHTSLSPSKQKVTSKWRTLSTQIQRRELAQAVTTEAAYKAVKIKHTRKGNGPRSSGALSPL